MRRMTMSILYDRLRLPGSSEPIKGLTLGRESRTLGFKTGVSVFGDRFSGGGTPVTVIKINFPRRARL